MAKDRFNLKQKSDPELYGWLSQQDHNSEEYNAGIRETMNRIATAEEKFDRKDPVHRREMIAIFIAFVALAFAIGMVILMFET